MSSPVTNLVAGYSSPATDQAGYMQGLNLNTLTSVTAASNLNSLAAAAAGQQQQSAVNNNNTLAYLTSSAVAGKASSSQLTLPQMGF